jgi:hypothetical protein
MGRVWQRHQEMILRKSLHLEKPAKRPARTGPFPEPARLPKDESLIEVQPFKPAKPGKDSPLLQAGMVLGALRFTGKAAARLQIGLRLTWGAA